jgi:hypothetical protein
VVSASASVAPTLTMSDPPGAFVLVLRQGRSSSSLAAPVRVTTNIASGYRLFVGRTAFTRGDIPVRIAAGAPASPGQVLDLTANALTPVPTLPALLGIGRRTGTMTGPAGDPWSTRLVVGRVPCIRPGLHGASVWLQATAAGVSPVTRSTALWVIVIPDTRVCRWTHVPDE